MKRCMLAVDVQPFYGYNEATVTAINRAAEKMPTVATVFEHDESRVPMQKLLGRAGPQGETCLVDTQNILRRSGYIIPGEVLGWLREQQPDEVIVSGANQDHVLLGSGLCLFEIGLKAVIVPSLCFGNDWYQHTVTVGIWEKNIGKVYENAFEVGL